MNTVVASLLLTAALAWAGLASAEEIRVPVLGKAPAALHAEIVRAAGQVCSDAAFDLSRPTSEDACIAASVAQAEIKAKSILTSPAYAAASNGR
jgi:hypothetical protein